MDKDSRSFYRNLAYISSAGLSIALCIVIGLFAGLYVDKELWDYSPWGLFIGLGLGLGAGTRNFLLIIKRAREM